MSFFILGMRVRAPHSAHHRFPFPAPGLDEWADETVGGICGSVGSLEKMFGLS